ncbi:SLC13/DASS family transporter [Sulfidibacter corallicola]|uniref:SLC13/DASS family transporter n=1 Tax=Sulfidibacter corallicola TaxID=2818388 RepID=A0A8A4TTB5_SULCO|nr:SLC13 family permease [Sulfidibacter corallicola]QTD52301.1 SLC13/DASS family transporter [Sulfidibacter corallicola]
MQNRPADSASTTQKPEKKRLDRTTIQWIGFFAGPLLAVVVYFLLPAGYLDSDGQTVAIGHATRATAATGAWMAVWWLSEAIPISATALLPLVLFPLTNAVPVKKVAQSYGHELIFLFMGGFFLSKAMERWGLHRRIALITLRYFGRGKRLMIAGFMLVTAVLSMWVSNTATAIMMLPIALSVIALVDERAEPNASGKSGSFAQALMLGIAYSASIGGLATLIGSPPNLFLASYVRDRFAMELSFSKWFMIGFPLSAIFLPLTWWLLTRVFYKVSPEAPAGGHNLIRDEYDKLGPINRGSLITMVVFFATAFMWLTRPMLTQMTVAGIQPLAGLTDATIAIMAGMLLFCLPVHIKERIFVLDWETAVKLPWGILILFGGGLALAAAIQANGLGAYMGSLVAGWKDLPILMLIVGVSTLVIFLTELTSNTATSATLIPILAAIAIGMGMDPIMLMFPAALAASLAFMMPVATPPNAIVFGSGKLTIPEMARVGLWLNLIGITLVTLASFFWVPVVMGN